ncbi:uncharacterized protein LOC135373901 isoform X3 [Ornithodoros turicata]|uniref:uncharacterized protein LOC135373901 isoform X3 n=1 Tax=Ornithodoros turicata TaxID=34597 RepID=UPI0031393DD8
MELSPKFSYQLTRVKSEPPDVPCLPGEGQIQQQHCNESTSEAFGGQTVGMCHIKEEPPDDCSDEHQLIEVQTEPYNTAILMERDHAGRSHDSTSEGQPEVIRWLMEQGALRSDMHCRICGRPATLFSPSTGTARWRCRNHGHNWGESVFHDSVFRKYKIPLKLALKLMHIFTHDRHSYRYLTLECSRDAKRIGDRTIVRWLSLCRSVVSAAVQRQVAAEGRIGGRGKIVEVDLSLFDKWKHHRGRARNGQWVLGMVEREAGPNAKREGGKLRAVVCPNNKRDKATLIPLIKRYVKRGTTIITDSWGGYRNLETLGENPQQWRRHGRRRYYAHKVVNHRLEFVTGPNCEVHTQTIESTWRLLKQSLHRRGPQRKDIQSYLDEQLWRKHVKRMELDPFPYFLDCAGRARSRVFSGTQALQCQTRPVPRNENLGRQPAPSQRRRSAVPNRGCAVTAAVPRVATPTAGGGTTERVTPPLPQTNAATAPVSAPLDWNAQAVGRVRTARRRRMQQPSPYSRPNVAPAIAATPSNTGNVPVIVNLATAPLPVQVMPTPVILWHPGFVFQQPLPLGVNGDVAFPLQNTGFLVQ